MARHKINFLPEFLIDFLVCSLASNTQALGSRILFSSILSIKCASTTYMNPFGKHVKRVHIVDAHFIDKIEEKKILDPSACVQIEASLCLLCLLTTSNLLIVSM